MFDLCLVRECRSCFVPTELLSILLDTGSVSWYRARSRRRKGGGIEEEEEIPDQKKLEGRKKQLVNEIRKLESFHNMDEEEHNKIQKKTGKRS